jgi:hypothetical protein
MEIPGYIMEKIRARRGLERGDTSQDNLINSESPLQRLQEVLGWELGDSHWADRILQLAKDCGFYIDNRKG